MAPIGSSKEALVPALASIAARAGTSASASTRISVFRELAEMGIDHAPVNMPNVSDLEPFNLLAAEVIPVVEKFEVAGR